MNGYLPNWIFITVVFAKRLFSMLDNYLKRVLSSCEVFITIFTLNLVNASQIPFLIQR